MFKQLMKQFFDRVLDVNAKSLGVGCHLRVYVNHDVHGRIIIVSAHRSFLSFIFDVFFRGFSTVLKLFIEVSSICPI